MTKDALTRSAYNQKFISGQIDQTFLELRDCNIINLECDNEFCRGHIQLVSEDLMENCYSSYQMSVCAICLDSAGVRVQNQIRLKNEGYFSLFKAFRMVFGGKWVF